LKSYNGRTLKLADYKGKVVVLAWWYLLCAPDEAGCRMIADLVNLKNSLGSQDLEVIGMPGIYPFKPTREAIRVRRLVAKYHINFDLVWDDGEFTHDAEESDKFGYSSSPQAFVISRSGYVVKRIRGYDGEALRTAVESALRDRDNN
jgi:peroxiredoxin